MQKLESERDFNRLCMNNFGKIIIIIFHAEWHEHSIEYLEQMTNLVELADFNTNQIIFSHLDAELVPEVTNKYNVNNVPTVVFTDTQKGELKKLENEAPGMVIEHIENFIKEYQKSFEEKKLVMYKKIEELVKSSPVLIFIKGTAADPYCKFSKQFLTVMKTLDCQFTYYDILADNDMRHWLRHYNKWPTYPQLYIEGQFIGGLDKTKQLLEEGVIQKKIPESARNYNPEQRFDKITNENLVVLFTKGLPNSENLDQNHQFTIKVLKETGIKFNCFNVLEDNNLNKLLSEKYGESNFPVLISNKQYAGPLEQLQQLQKEDKLLDKIPSSEWQLNGQQKLKYLLKSCPVIAFINGIPKETHDERSYKLVDILKNLNVIYEFYNLDADEELKNNLYELSKYEKSPQFYVQGQLIGGIETVEQLQKDGDLQEIIKNYVRK